MAGGSATSAGTKPRRNWLRAAFLTTLAGAGLLAGSYASAQGNSYDGTYSGTLNYSAQTGSGPVTGTTSISLSVSGSGFSGSFGPVPQYGTVAISGSVAGSGAGSGSGAFSCGVSFQLTLSGSSVSGAGSITGCTDQGGTATGSFTVTRTSAPPATSASAPATTAAPTTTAAPPPTTTPAPTPTTSKPTPVPQAGKETARVGEITGHPTVKRPDGSTAPITGKTLLHPGDIVLTDQRSSVELELLGGGYVLVRPGSQLQLIAANARALTWLELLGRVRYSLKQCRRVACRVTSSIVCACVRGTQFELEVRPNWARIRVYDHVVDFHRLATPKKRVLVGAGYESTITGSGQPSKPRRF